MAVQCIPLALACGAGLIPPAPVEDAATTPIEHTLDLVKHAKPLTAKPKAKPKRKHVSYQATLTKTGRAIAPEGAPKAVRQIIKAGNRIAHKPYLWGGGHGTWESAGYDCSGSVSYALHGAKRLDQAMASGGLMSYGNSGKGKWVTIYAHGGHAYMVVAGLRFDTTAFKQGGSRWTRDLRGGGGFTVRHPKGL